MTVHHPRERWRWQGSAGHFICGDRCRYHLTTIVGPWIVSTVGEYVSVMDVQRDGGSAAVSEVGLGRLYETMVFRAGPTCRETVDPCGLCGERHQTSGENLDFAATNTRADAERAHLKLCNRWSKRRKDWKP